MPLLFSVIVPAYNVENYIEECIRSIERQDIDRDFYEVIVVDDASTDSTGEILSRLAAEFDNIRVITNSTNLRMGPSRNLAIDMSEGKYIMFVDSDDYWQPNILKGLAERMERDDLQMLQFAFNNVSDSGKYLSSVKINFPNERVVTGEESIVPERFLAYVWNYVWRGDWVKRCNVKMPSIAFEDIEFTLKMLSMADRVGYIAVPKYNYRRRPQSILRCFNPQRHLDMIEAFAHVKDFLESNGNLGKWQSFRPVAQICLFCELRYVIKKRVGVERKILNAMYSMNLMPVPNPLNSFRTKFFNLNPELFMIYYKITHFPTRAKQLISKKPLF